MRPTAQYLRMSSDKQPFSIAVQEAAIAQYAAANDMSIVATYIDEARSGMSLSGREAMQRLLSDVVQKNCPFTAVLVLDVTRWGRFQDVDESAYHEYHCRKSGVEVLYVAESFRAEHPLDALMKQLKRTMAAEYSRDLGVKCRAGVIRAVTSGYAAGTLPCLGYRRQAVSATGEEKGLLKQKERKPCTTDRVRWVLGPPSEVSWVQKIFADYVSGTPIAAILRELANEGVRSHTGRPVSHFMVHRLLGNPIVIGSFEWGLRDGRKTSATGIPPLASNLCNREMLAPIVSLQTWNLAQARLTEAAKYRERGIPSEILIQKLHEVLCLQPGLRSRDFKQYGLPTPDVYRAHFGCLEHAYYLAGVSHDVERRLAALDAHSAAIVQKGQLVKDLLRLLAESGVHAQRMDAKDILVINGVQVAVKIARMLESVRADRWLTRISPPGFAPGRWLLIMRLNADALTGQDFYLLPPHEMQRFNGLMNKKAVARLADFQLCTGPGVARALSELGAQKQLV